MVASRVAIPTVRNPDECLVPAVMLGRVRGYNRRRGDRISSALPPCSGCRTGEAGGCKSDWRGVPLSGRGAARGRVSNRRVAETEESNHAPGGRTCQFHRRCKVSGLLTGKRLLDGVVTRIAAGVVPIALLLGGGTATVAAADADGRCPERGVWVQVLGSGGPEVEDLRASSSYLVWRDGRALVLIDSGGGSALRFGQSGASVADLGVVAFTHLHVDHSADFPALVKSSYFDGRRQDLPVLGPTGNDWMPATDEFVTRLFRAGDGVYRYLSDFLDTPSDAYRLLPRVVGDGESVRFGTAEDAVTLTAASVHHGPIPALAWAVQMGDAKIVFSGDMNGSTGHLERLARDADLLVAHNAIPEDAIGAARNLHMPPSVIGEIAAEAKVRRLVLSHRMLRTLGREDETRALIRQRYAGAVAFADDLDCFVVARGPAGD